MEDPALHTGIVIISVDIPRDLCAPARARRAIAALGLRIDAELLPDVTLLVSELVTNCVKYGGPGELHLRARSQHPGHIHVEVLDHGPGFVPEERVRPVTEAGGWGLRLVQQLTDRWGVEAGAGHVWFEIDREPGTVSR